MSFVDYRLSAKNLRALPICTPVGPDLIVPNTIIGHDHVGHNQTRLDQFCRSIAQNQSAGAIDYYNLAGMELIVRKMIIWHDHVRHTQIQLDEFC